MSNPIVVTLVAYALAVGVNVYYFCFGDDLTIVVSRTMFADMLLVLSLVPVYRAVQIKNSGDVDSLVDRLKAGLKPVAMYTFLVALTTFILFKLCGEPLVAQRMLEIQTAVDNALIEGKIMDAEAAQQLEMTKQFYSPTFHVAIVLLGNLFTGFVSAILASILIKK